MRKIKENKGFTLAELLIVVAVIAVLVAISIPIFTSQLEKSREATDLANVRAAYAHVMAAAIIEDETAVYKGAPIYYAEDSATGGKDMYVAVVPLKQKKDGWNISNGELVVGGVSQIDTNWVNEPKADASCTVYYSMNPYMVDGVYIESGVALDWGGEAKGSSNSEDDSLISNILGLGESLIRSGWVWGNVTIDGVKVAKTTGSDKEEANRISLTTTPIALSEGAEVEIDTKDGYSSGYYLLKYKPGYGYEVVTDSGWKNGKVNFTVPSSADGEFYYLVTNMKKGSGGSTDTFTYEEAEKNANITIRNNKANNTSNMTGTTITNLSNTEYKEKTALKNTSNQTTGGQIYTETNNGRGCVVTNVEKGSVLSFNGDSNNKMAYFYAKEDGTVLFDSGWLKTGTKTATTIPDNCKLYIQVEGSNMTEERLKNALNSVTIYK